MTRRTLRPARVVPPLKSETFAALPSVKKKSETNRQLLDRVGDDVDEDDEEEEKQEDEDDERGARPTLGTMEALAFQQSILGEMHFNPRNTGWLWIEMGRSEKETKSVELLS